MYTVTLSGETLGYVKEKSELKNKINEYIRDREGTIVLKEIAVMPEYKLELISRNDVTQEKHVLETIEDTAVITYRTYGITVNGEVKAEVDTEIEAQDVISNLQQGLPNEVKLELGFIEVYKNEQTLNSKDTAFTSLNEIKIAKVAEYEAEQERLKKEAEKAAAEEAARKAEEEAKKAASKGKLASASSGSGNVNGLNIVNPLRATPRITSRFGEKGSRRYTHTGLDLAISQGTPIYPIADGVVIFSGSNGSYGNMIKIDHGDGIQSWYAHCSALLVSEGTKVTKDTNIAKVGSTGNSTGPHLHLEIRVNGTAVNPQNYLY